MYKVSSYPVITTDHFSETVAFYEDMFGFVPIFENEGYARMRHKDEPSALLAIIKADNAILPPALLPEKGQILSLATKEFEKAYDDLYHEGLEIIKEPTEIGTGIRHFLVADPNNSSIVINVITSPECVEVSSECEGCC